MPSPGALCLLPLCPGPATNEAVAAVDNGTVTAAAPGTATITAEVNGKSLTCSVTVSYAGVDGISLDRSALTLGQRRQHWP